MNLAGFLSSFILHRSRSQHFAGLFPRGRGFAIISAPGKSYPADIAQSVEQLFRKQQVVGSSPTVGFKIQP
jgi:hypothetical protein